MWFETLGKALNEKSKKFENLSLDEQSKVLNQVLHRFQCNATYPNLKQIDIREGVNAIRKSNNIANFNSIKLIHQSPSGLFEQETDLQKL
jgi:CRISPR-associated endonuclease Csn1